MFSAIVSAAIGGFVIGLILDCLTNNGLSNLLPKKAQVMGAAGVCALIGATVGLGKHLFGG